MTEDLFSANILQTEEEQPQAQTPEQDAPEVVVSSDAGGYTDDAIQTLKWNEHIRRRPGMYIGKLGDGSHPEDGIYVLMKEVLDNSVDEFNMKAGNRIDITLTEEGTVTVRDYGRGIPLGKVKEVASEINTGGKFDDKNFKKSVGLNGVGLKAVNALSRTCRVESVRDGQKVTVLFDRGDLVSQTPPTPTDEPNGTLVQFTPDDDLFKGYRFNPETIEMMVNNYTYLNVGLQLMFNGKKYQSRHGLLDLLRENMTSEPLYPIIHLKGDDIEVVLTHTNQNGEEYYSFVNGQHTTQGGTHLSAFKEAVSRTIKEYFNRSFEYSDIRNGMIAAVAIKVEEPVFESQTKTKLGSRDIGPEGPTVAKFVGDFIKKELDNYLHKNLDIADIILKKVQESERDRKAMAGVTKAARERIKKIAVHNKKLFDCVVHLSDAKGDDAKRQGSSIFITEGDSASGSITRIRDVQTQAVFALRGKPLNTYGMPLPEVYKNDEFALLRAALNIEDSLDNLRYNKVIIATDADVDGMHIRLLIITYFLQFFPDLIKKGHLYVLQTPLFRVRDKRKAKRSGKKSAGAALDSTTYCYSDEERIRAIESLGTNAEITRFKGLGEIDAEEFKTFIGPDMRLDRVSLRKEDGVAELLEFYMGKNTMERQNFIINNLVIEDDSQL